MSIHRAEVHWRLGEGEDFPAGRYRRAHRLGFDGGAEVAGSASPQVVGKWADPGAIDPEEMLVAAISACHMLTFLHRARLAGFTVLAYRDHAEGVMAEIAPERHAVTRVTLRPAITWRGAAPDPARLAALHHEAHEHCFIANSIRTEVTIGPPP